MSSWSAHSISWTDVVERGISRGQLAGVVPGVLAYYDLPDLAARLESVSADDPPSDKRAWPAGHPGELEAAYSACLQAYGQPTAISRSRRALDGE